MTLIDEYTIKKHIFTIFILLLISGVAFFYVKGEALFSRFIDKNLDAEEFIYSNNNYKFSLLYPADYLTAEERGKDYLNVYFTRERESPFRLKKSVTLSVVKGERAEYLQNAKNRENAEIISDRQLTVGDRTLAQQLVFRFKNIAEDKKSVETVFARPGLVFIIRQNYNEKIDNAYPLILKSFRFE